PQRHAAVPGRAVGPAVLARRGAPGAGDRDVVVGALALLRRSLLATCDTRPARRDGRLCRAVVARDDPDRTDLRRLCGAALLVAAGGDRCCLRAEVGGAPDPGQTVLADAQRASADRAHRRCRLTRA